MFDPIVVGVDGREGGRDALALAGFLRATFGGRVIAVTAYPHDTFPVRATRLPYDGVVAHQAHTMLEREVRDAGVQAQAMALPDSSPARALHDVAEREQAALIVVGSDHQGAIGHVLAGDVTAGALYGAPCPVAVAPLGLAGRAESLRTIGVGYDGSPESAQALALARAVAERTGAALELVCVVQRPIALAEWAIASYAPEDVEDAERERVEALAAAALRDLRAPAVSDVVEGVPHEELVRRSAELDLLVVGSRGYGPLRRLLLGSTSSRLVHRAACPVLVLPRGAHEPDLEALDAAVVPTDASRA
jgi:nucleotide-binding universal stress UspA family protein